MSLTTNFEFNKNVKGGTENIWGDDYAIPADADTQPSPGVNGNWRKLEFRLADNDALITALEAEAAGIPQELESLEVQVGALYVSETDDDPATTLGYGNWEPFAVGRALISAGDNGETDWASEATAGAANVTLSTANLPSHTHSFNPPSVTTSSVGNHTHTYSQKNSSFIGGYGGSGAGGANGSVGQWTGYAGSHTHTLNIAAFTSGSAGSGGSHNNEQPALGVYIWKRIAD